jgi:hypothetical protein
VPVTSDTVGRKHEAEALVDDDGGAPGGLPLQRDRDADRLEGREDDRAVARVLGDLPPPGLTLLLQLLQLRNHRRHQLHDDAGGDVRHDAEREYARPLQSAAREHVEHVQDRALVLVEQDRQRLRVDTGHRNEGADAIDQQRADDEQQSLPQVRLACPSPKGLHGRCLRSLPLVPRVSAALVMRAVYSAGLSSAVDAPADAGVSDRVPPAASISALRASGHRNAGDRKGPATAPDLMIFTRLIRGRSVPAAQAIEMSHQVAIDLAELAEPDLVATEGARERKPIFGRRRCSGI